MGQEVSERGRQAGATSRRALDVKEVSLGETQWTRLQHAKKVETERGQIVELINRLPPTLALSLAPLHSVLGASKDGFSCGGFSNGSSGVKSVLVSAMQGAAVHSMPTRPSWGFPQ